MSEKVSVPFPSIRWAEQYQEFLNTDSTYEDSAKDWEGAMLFIINPDGGHTPVPIGVWLDLLHGTCRGYAFWVEGQGYPENQYIFAGPETNWLGMVDGKIDPIQGLMTGKFKLTGNMAMVMRHTIAAKKLVENLQKFDLDVVSVDDPGASVLQFKDSTGTLILTLDREANTFEMLQ